MSFQRYKQLVDEVALIVGDDGTADLGVIVHEALKLDPGATPESIAAVVLEAREEWAAERLRENIP